MRVCVYGAGSIGCYVGGRLAAAGADVVLVGRERLAKEVREHGLRITDWQGADIVVRPEDVRYETSTEAAAGADLVLVTVKSAATGRAAAELEPVIARDAVVVSFQNGVRNADALRAGLPGRTVLAGMVAFNVIQRGEGGFHAGTEGGLEVADSPVLTSYLEIFERAGLPLERHAEMLPVMWAKLLLNLNNSINALSGLPLKTQLSQRAFRRCMALAQDETLGVLTAAGITPARITPVPPQWFPRLLRLPDVMFRSLAGRTLAMDPHARSSMLDDLDAGRTTEVDHLNGEVVRLAGDLGRTAPVNARLVELVHAAETGGRRGWTGDDLYDDLRAAARA
ncbi:MAG TPA: 2-dehydropantoate 2-reductase [Kribbellaceae bacterium]